VSIDDKEHDEIEAVLEFKQAAEALASAGAGGG
jgi:hypothetical protein